MYKVGHFFETRTNISIFAQFLYHCFEGRGGRGSGERIGGIFSIAGKTSTGTAPPHETVRQKEKTRAKNEC